MSQNIIEITFFVEHIVETTRAINLQFPLLGSKPQKVVFLPSYVGQTGRFIIYVSIINDLLYWYSSVVSQLMIVNSQMFWSYSFLTKKTCFSSRFKQMNRPPAVSSPRYVQVDGGPFHLVQQLQGFLPGTKLAGSHSSTCVTKMYNLYIAIAYRCL